MNPQSEADARTAADASQARRTSGPYAWYALGVLVVVYTLNFIDRQILSILAEDIKDALVLEDGDLGFLYGTAFAVFYAVFGVPLGRLADNWRRGHLMAMGLALWSGMTALSGFATNYAQLAAARIGVGIGEASASPAAFSMLAGYFPKNRRALAASIYTSGVYLGMGLSLPIGGLISDNWNTAFAGGGAPLGLQGWQVTFLAVGLPGLLVALWVMTLREPVRRTDAGVIEPVVRPGAWRMFLADVMTILPPFTLWSVSRFPGALRRNLIGLAVIVAIAFGLIRLTGDAGQWIAYAVGFYALFSWTQSLRFTDPPTHKLILGSPVVPLAVLGFGCLAVITYVISFWGAPFAMRTYDVSASTAGVAIGLPGAAAAAAGVILGGRLSDLWKERDPRGRIFTCMLAAVLPAPFIVAMVLAPDFGTYVLLSPCVYFLANLWTGSAVATYQDFVLPRMYGTISAVYLVGSTMVGLSLGPYASGKIAAVSGSLQAGVISMLAASVVALVALWALSLRAEAAETTKLERAIAAGEPPPVAA
ncbi:MFS transporter [Phenylobacterium sp. SCN 70-31]|uniref:MFS transporter n=1 Tax=Phenylobacterium sp. SCN 70-31 TaxID=1660129 RepID=UPI00086CBB6E|nr:MFS transporter [Phenylobacterium sp. SCN 70-31]ODT89637.1 MAG: MFS transporter [Phenylobacterium sp. SCN 70-31]